MFTRGDSGASNLAAVGIEAPAGQSGASTSDTTDVFGSSSPIFIDGPSTPPKPAVIQIVVPAEEPGTFVDGGASYQAVVGQAADSCNAPDAPFGATLTVTNRDNGFATTCVNRAPNGLTPGLEIVLPTDLFSKIAQLVDAPVPVRITWQGTG